MWLDTTGQADLIQMEPAGIRAGAQQIVNGVIQGADAMGIHFNAIGTADASFCLCDPWESSVPGLVEEAAALGGEVISAFHAYLANTTDAVMRANQLLADQAQASAVAGVGPGADTSFSALLAQAIVNDANNRAASVWLDGPAPTSQVDLLLAMQGQGGGGGSLGLTLTSMIDDSNNDAIKTWLAPDGTSYIGADDYGRDQYKDRQGDVGTMSEIHRDENDYNNNNDFDDYDV